MGTIPHAEKLMTVASCPKCEERVSVPSARPTARVRCPLCQEEYELSEALDRLPPALVVLDAREVTTASAHAPAAASAATDLEPLNAGHYGGFESAGGGSPAFDFDEGSAPAASPAATVRTSPRKQKKGRNPVFEIAKVVIGGIVGLSIAQLVLWWLPFNLEVYRRDPIHIGRTVGQYVPFIVPADVREAAANDQGADGGDNRGGDQDDDDKGRGSGNGRADGQGRERGAGDGGGLDGMQSAPPLPGVGDDSTPDDGRDPFASDGGAPPPADDDPSNVFPDAGPDFDPVGPPLEDPFGVKIPPVTGNPGNDPEAAPRSKVGFVSGVPRTSAAGLERSIDAVRKAREEFDKAQSAQTARDLYESLAELAESAAFLNRETADSQRAILEAGDLLAELGDLAGNLNKLTPWWRDRPDRSSDGVFLAGKVRSVLLLENGYFQIDLAGEGSDKPVSIVGWEEAHLPPEGAEAVILAAIVDKPEVKLAGLTTTKAELLVAGHVLVVSADNPEE